jgi:hypothetical protein
VKASVRVTVPLALTKTRFFSPSVEDGVVSDIEVEVFAPLVAALPPKVAEVILDKFVPVTTVTVPPVIGPEVTDSEVIVGKGRYV